MADNYLNGYIANCFNGITLPGTQGPTGADGTDGGESLIFNAFTRTASTDDLNSKTYITKTLTAGELASDGDALEIEAMFTISVGVAGTFQIDFGGATVATYTVNSPLLRETVITLKSVVSRTGAATQKVEGSYTIVGLGDTTGSIPITTASETLANALVINLISRKTVSVGAADIYSESLRIKKLGI